MGEDSLEWLEKRLQQLSDFELFELVERFFQDKHFKRDSAIKKIKHYILHGENRYIRLELLEKIMNKPLIKGTELDNPYTSTLVDYLYRHKINKHRLTPVIHRLRELGLKKYADLLEWYQHTTHRVKLGRPAFLPRVMVPDTLFLPMLTEPDFYSEYVVFLVESIVLNVRYKLPLNYLNIIKNYLSYTGLREFSIRGNTLLVRHPMPKRLVLPSNPPLILEFHGLELWIESRAGLPFISFFSSEPRVVVKPLWAPRVTDTVSIPEHILEKPRAERFSKQEIRLFRDYLLRIISQGVYVDQARILEHVKLLEPGDLLEISGERGIGKTSAILAAALGRKVIYIYYDKDTGRLQVKNPNVFLPGALRDPRLRSVFSATDLEKLKDALTELRDDTLLILDDVHYLYDCCPELAKELVDLVISLDHLPRVIVGDDSVTVKAFLRGFYQQYAEILTKLQQVYLPRGLRYSVALKIIASKYPNLSPAWKRLMALAFVGRSYREIVQLLPRLQDYTLAIEDSMIRLRPDPLRLRNRQPEVLPA